MRISNISSVFNKPEKIFLIIGSVFGVLSIALMPALTAPDEGAHFWLSYGMFSKNDRTPEDLLISPEESVTMVNEGVYFDLVFKKTADLNNDGFQVNIVKQVSLNDGFEPRSVSSFDVSHIPQGLGILLGRATYPSVGVMTTLGRIANLLLYLISIYFIIKHVRHSKLVFAFIALFPILIHQAASLSYDVTNIVVIFAWVALMINLFIQRAPLSSKQLLLLVALAIGLIITKRSNVLLLWFLPFLIPALYSSSSWYKSLIKDPLSKINKKVIYSIITIGGLFATIGLAIFLDQFLENRGISVARFIEVIFNTFFRPEVNTQLDPILTTGIVGHFGWLWYRLPEWIVIIHLGVLGLLLLGERAPRVSKSFALTSGLIFALSIAAITFGMYLEWTLRSNIAGIGANFAQGMQGRYFTPLLVLLIPPFAYLQKYISVKVSPRTLAVIAATMAVFSLTIYIVLTYIFFYTPATGVKEILLQ